MCWSPDRSGFGFLRVAFSHTLVCLVTIVPSERSCHASWEQDIMPQNPLPRFHICASSSYLSVLSREAPELFTSSPSGRCSVVFPGTPLAALIQALGSDYFLQQAISFRNARKESDIPTLWFSCRVSFITPRGAGSGLAVFCSSGGIQLGKESLVSSQQATRQHTYSLLASSLSLVGGRKGTQGHTI